MCCPLSRQHFLNQVRNRHDGVALILDGPVQTRSAGRVAHRYLNLQIFFLSGISGACVLLWNYCVPRYCYMYCRSDCGAVLDLSTNLGSSFRLRNHSHLVKDLRFSPTKRLNRAHTVVNTRYWGRLNRDNKSGKTPLHTLCSLSLFVRKAGRGVLLAEGCVVRLNLKHAVGIRLRGSSGHRGGCGCCAPQAKTCCGSRGR